ncbi:MAG: helix-turn-helix domain-containing protein [Bacteriovoracaceae bacterium]|nr:helix-turn-helix domain-containing protein [Bacteriovoracaceae bacterium]
MGKRSRRIEMSREAEVLRSMRLDREFSMRKAADLLGVSSTTINHVEDGRANILEEYIESFLDALGYTQEDWGRYFAESKVNDIKDNCMDLIENFSSEKLELAKRILQTI